MPKNTLLKASRTHYIDDNEGSSCSGTPLLSRILILAGMAFFVVLGVGMLPQPEVPKEGMVTISSTNSSQATTAITTTTTTNSRLVCWRNSTVPHGQRKFLVTGCGYSSTGFVKAAFSAAGYDVGHERPGRDGVSAWQAATGNFYDWAPPFSFQHVYLVVRHPLKVIRSRAGTGWDFDIGRVEESVSIQPRADFDKMKMEYKTLDWWYSYTSMGENLAECYYRAEDMNPQLLLDLCLRSELPGCASKQWKLIIQNSANYNSHTKHLSSNWTINWTDLERNAETTNEKAVLERARLLCRRFYENC